MRYLVYLSRILVGSLFIVSGLIKANDPKGFSYKLEEYFAESALNWPMFEPYALTLAILVCYGEIILGFALLFGAKFRLTTGTLVFLCLFFLWLTHYTANCNESDTYITVINGIEQEQPVTCVTDCGCFGDAMKGSIGRSLTPWESFYKDLAALIALIPSMFCFAFWFMGKKKDFFYLNDSKADVILFIGSLIGIAIWSWIFTWYFPILFAIVGWTLYWLIKKYIGKSGTHEWIMGGAITAIALAFIFHVINHLPVRDYRPYAKGVNVKEERKSAEERNLKPPVYATEFTFTNTVNGKDSIVLSTDWMKIYKEPWFAKYENKSFDGKSILIEEGHVPSVPPDFAFESMERGDITEEIMDLDNVLLFISYDIESAKTKAAKKFAAVSDEAQKNGFTVYGATSSDLSGVVEDFRHEHQLAFEFLQGDEKVLKTIVRSNPGLVWFKNGVVMEKWAAGDIPDFNEIKD